jgi:hypothetical protein
MFHAGRSSGARVRLLGLLRGKWRGGECGHSERYGKRGVAEKR